MINSKGEPAKMSRPHHVKCASASQSPQRLDGAGLDLVIYSLRKWMRLAIGGNPIAMPAPFPRWLRSEDELFEAFETYDEFGILDADAHLIAVVVPGDADTVERRSNFGSENLGSHRHLSKL
jgi:hypothetical protein